MGSPPPQPEEGDIRFNGTTVSYFDGTDGCSTKNSPKTRHYPTCAATKGTSPGRTTTRLSRVEHPSRAAGRRPGPRPGSRRSAGLRRRHARHGALDHRGGGSRRSGAGGTPRGAIRARRLTTGGRISISPRPYAPTSGLAVSPPTSPRLSNSGSRWTSCGRSSPASGPAMRNSLAKGSRPPALLRHDHRHTGGAAA